MFKKILFTKIKCRRRSRQVSILGFPLTIPKKQCNLDVLQRYKYC